MEQDYEILKNQTLTDITLPGTHESGAYWVSNEVSSDAPDFVKDFYQKYKISFSYFFKKWSTNQGLTIYEQLMRGIRFLDLRNCENENGDFKMCHGLYGNSFEIFLSDIKKFMENYRKEILVITLTSRSSVKNHQKFINLVKKYLETWLLETKEGYIQIGKMIERNKRIILYYSNSRYANDNIWPNYHYSSHWANTNELDQLMKNEINWVKQNSGNPKKFIIPQWVLTETDREIKNSIYLMLNLPGRTNFKVIDGIKRFVSSTNQKLIEFIKATENYRFNALEVDFMNGIDVVTFSRLLNDNCNDNPKFRGNSINSCRYLKKYKGLCVNPDDFMKQNCKRTCGLCPKIKGYPGDDCFLNNDCKSGNCHLTKKICLINDPRVLDSECGNHYQCTSGYCNADTLMCEFEKFPSMITFFVVSFVFIFAFTILFVVILMMTWKKLNRFYT
eukprot:gene12134-5625_t